MRVKNVWILWNTPCVEGRVPPRPDLEMSLDDVEIIPSLDSVEGVPQIDDEEYISSLDGVKAVPPKHRKNSATTARIKPRLHEFY